MRILFATDQYFPTPGGITVVIYRLAKALTKKGHTVGIIAPATSWKFSKETQEGWTIFRVPSLLVFKAQQVHYSPVFLYRDKIKEIITVFRPNIVHIETPYAIAHTTARFAKEAHIPLVGTCHIMSENILSFFPFLPDSVGRAISNFYMRRMIQVFNTINFVTSPTMTGITILKDYGLITASMALSNGIDLKDFGEIPAKRKEEMYERFKLPHIPLVVYIGRLAKEKRVEVLIEAIALLPKDLQFHAVIAGTGEEEQRLRALVRTLRIEKQISFLGNFSWRDLLTMYSITTLFVMPSTAELQSLVTMEAMASHLPVIGAHAGALPYLIKPGRNGFLFTPDDPVDLASDIKTLLQDPSLCKKMGGESWRLIQEHDISIIVKKLEKIYQELIEKGK